ncbi:MAG: hypothetical protein R3C14_02755 [Caldilineaceae bacterium]
MSPLHLGHSLESLPPCLLVSFPLLAGLLDQGDQQVRRRSAGLNPFGDYHSCDQASGSIEQRQAKATLVVGRGGEQGRDGGMGYPQLL